MSFTSTIDPVLLSVAAVLPASEYTTEELLVAGRGHFSDQLEDMLGGLGVIKRHSVLSNYPDVLFRRADPILEIETADLAVAAARQCLEKSDIAPDSIGLVLGVTSAPGRLLPSLVCDVIARMPEISRTVSNLAIEYMGCSAMAKAVETARWFLSCNPDKNVLVCFTEAITPMSPPLPEFYSHFTEVPASQRQRTVDALHGFLFADASVAMVLGARGDGPSFGPVVNLTNALASDAELGTVPDGGSDIPVVHGRRIYTLSADVTPRGAFYAEQTVDQLLGSEDCGLDTAADASALLLHTGSTRILDSLCDRFGVAPDADSVASSYRVLRDYGNTLGCSVPLMVAEPTHRPAGQALLVAFGLSFSCGAFTMTVPEGGWRA